MKWSKYLFVDIGIFLNYELIACIFFGVGTVLTSLALFSGFSERKSMGLGALQACWKRASNRPKIIKIDLYISAGDEFQKIFSKIFRNFWKFSKSQKSQNLRFSIFRKSNEKSMKIENLKFWDFLDFWKILKNSKIFFKIHLQPKFVSRFG